MNQPLSPLQIAKSLTELWSPQVIAEVNDMYVKVAKAKGELPWHAHEHEDEMFLILQGEFTLDFEDGSVTLEVGDVHVVPRGKRHRPSAKNECLMMIFEQKSTSHTGNELTSQTKSISDQLQWINSR